MAWCVEYKKRSGTSCRKLQNPQEQLTYNSVTFVVLQVGMRIENLNDSRNAKGCLSFGTPGWEVLMQSSCDFLDDNFFLGVVICFRRPNYQNSHRAPTSPPTHLDDQGKNKSKAQQQERSELLEPIEIIWFGQKSDRSIHIEAMKWCGEMHSVTVAGQNPIGWIVCSNL